MLSCCYYDVYPRALVSTTIAYFSVLATLYYFCLSSQQRFWVSTVLFSSNDDSKKCFLFVCKHTFPFQRLEQRLLVSASNQHRFAVATTIPCCSHLLFSLCNALVLLAAPILVFKHAYRCPRISCGSLLPFGLSNALLFRTNTQPDKSRFSPGQTRVHPVRMHALHAREV